MINKQVLVFLVASLFSLSTFGQISQGGLPPSFLHKNNFRSALSTTNIPISLDINRLMWEDEIVERNDGPARVAEGLPVDIDINKTGDWINFSDSLKVWKQTIYAKDAKGLIISYEDFYIPEGAKLFIYNEDHSQVLGAYTKATHPHGGAFATEVIFGEEVTLEYVASTISDESPRIVIKDIGYIYNTESMLRSAPIINNSSECMINVNCPEGDNWRNQQRGVVLLLIKVNLRWVACTGSLVNNTNRDGTPYILTADHCFMQDGIIDYSKMIVYFNLEFPGCANEDILPQTAKSLVGVDLMVRAPVSSVTAGVTTKGSDGALLKIKENVPLEWKPFYNGWDRREYGIVSGVVIHHPNFDVKKITTFKENKNQDQIVSGTYRGTDYTGVDNGFWRVQYDGNSVTQGGSSGAPLFNQEGLIIGTLTGGATYCYAKLAYDYYGKFAYHWDYFSEPDKRLKTYLDPINEGTMTLKGYDPNYPTGSESETVDNSIKDIVIFPTLADAELNINTSSIIRAIKIFDLSGRQVYAKSGYNASTTVVPVSGWQKGVYSIIIQTDNGKLTEKFVKK